MKLQYIVRNSIVICLALSLMQCKTATKAEKGGGIGAAVGAVVGVAVGIALGGDAESAAIGGTIGGAVGGATGAVIGHRMDQQAQRIEEEIPGIEVTKVEETKVINVTFDETNGVYFDSNKYNLNTSSEETIKKLANILNEYPDTDIVVTGHTDNVGKEENNLLLSKNRAQSVANCLIKQGIDAERFKVRYEGEFKPRTTNDTKEGRSKNRRVEITITPRKKIDHKDPKTMSNMPTMNKPEQSAPNNGSSPRHNGVISF